MREGGRVDTGRQLTFEREGRKREGPAACVDRRVDVCNLRKQQEHCEWSVTIRTLVR